MLTESTIVKPKKTRYYAVTVGREVGVYCDRETVKGLVQGHSGGNYKKFKTEEEALAYFDQHQVQTEEPPFMPSEFDGHGLGSSLPGYEQYARYVGTIPHEPGPFSDNPSFERTAAVHSHQMSSFHMRSPYAPEDLKPVDLGQDFTPQDVGPKLVPEQQNVVDLILQGHNVFYTGSAGCGKSTILKAFVTQLQQRGKRVKIVAPTNLAALNVGGQTTWNFAGWTPDSMKKNIDKLMENSRGKESWQKFDETDVLVIDEISMIENLMFERLNMIMKASRGEKYGGGAFGGVQVIATGDVSAQNISSSTRSDRHSSTNLPP